MFNLDFGAAGGIPRIEVGLLPDVRLKVDQNHFGDDCGVGTFCEPYTVWHSIEMDGRNVVATPLDLTSTSPISCGFSGGCIWEMTGFGFEANIRNNISTVKVCGIEAPIVDSSVAGSCTTDMYKACVKIPHMQTSLSVTDFVLEDELRLGSNNPQSKFVDNPSSGLTDYSQECAFIETANPDFSA